MFLWHRGRQRKQQALILDAEGNQPFPVTNDRAGFDGLLQQLKPLSGTVTIALEATGHYWLVLYKVGGKDSCVRRNRRSYIATSGSKNSEKGS